MVLSRHWRPLLRDTVHGGRGRYSRGLALQRGRVVSRREVWVGWSVVLQRARLTNGVLSRKAPNEMQFAAEKQTQSKVAVSRRREEWRRCV